MYNDIVMEHFNHPRNVGELFPCSVSCQYTNEICGDTAFFYLDIQDGIIQDIRFKMFGCAAGIAACSMLSCMVKGKDIDTAKAVTAEEVEAALGGLPDFKHNCVGHAVNGLQEAIREYENHDA